MKKIILCVIVCFSLLSLSHIIIYAHSGKTDDFGGHYDHDNGEYHYHHGYPEHDHINGKCPYDFDDQTNHFSSNDNSSTESTLNYWEKKLEELKKEQTTTTTTIVQEEKQDRATPLWKNIVGLGFGAVLLFPVILAFFFSIYHKIIKPIIEHIRKT